MYYQNLLNQKIGHWKVVGIESHGTDKKTKALCKCDCGTISAVDAYSLTHGLTSSCGKCKTIIREKNYMRCIMKNGASFIFDFRDYDMVSSHSWSFSRGHIRTTVDGKSVFLHRMILNAPKYAEVDHVNMDKTDNRRSNLRLANHAENQRNRGPHRGNQSGFKGVCQYPGREKWFAYINKDNKRFYLGSFDSPAEAAKAYDDAALKLHGEFARTNFYKEYQQDGNKKILEMAELSA